MSILDRSHDQPTGWGETTFPVRDLTREQAIRLTVEARCAAVRAAALLAQHRPGYRSSADVTAEAARFEAWILREAESE